MTSDAEAELRKAVRRAAREQPGAAERRDGLRRRARRRRGATALQIARLPSVEHVVARRRPAGGRRALDLDADVAAASRTRASVGHPRVVAHSGRLRRALHILRDDDGARRESQPPIDELVREATVLAERHAEIVITGIHIGTYGADTGTSLGALMTRLVRDGARGTLSTVVDRSDRGR